MGTSRLADNRCDAHNACPCRYTGGHFDHYVARYSGWQAGGLDESVFDKPPHCKPEGLEVTARRPGLDLRTELLSLLPPAHHGAMRTGIRLQMRLCKAAVLDAGMRLVLSVMLGLCGL